MHIDSDVDDDEFDSNDGETEIELPKSAASGAARKLEIRRKIEERMEEKRLRDELG